MPRLKLTLAYDGAAYEGWQIQEKANPPPTIQGAVETALFTLTGKKIRVFGAGRTDAGVHATGQVAHCDVPDRNWDWRMRLNAVLPADIRIVEAAFVGDGFHARRDAIAKTYCYQFWLAPEFVAPMCRNQVWAVGPLSIERMRNGLNSFLGEQDFASFRNSGTDARTSVRKIREIRLDREDAQFFAGFPAPILRLTITGTGFLKQMVRNIAGFLAAVGRSRLDYSELPAILAARNRQALPAATAPAKALFLVNVDYGSDR